MRCEWMNKEVAFSEEPRPKVGASSYDKAIYAFSRNRLYRKAYHIGCGRREQAEKAPDPPSRYLKTVYVLRHKAQGPFKLRLFFSLVP